MRKMGSYINGFVQSIVNKGCRRRVNELPGSYFSQVPPQRTRSRIMLVPLVCVVVFVCLLSDPRDPRQVLVAQGVHPHPGPDHGFVKQAVEDIEDAMQQRKRQDDREAPREDEANKTTVPIPFSGLREQRICQPAKDQREMEIRTGQGWEPRNGYWGKQK